jgi:hypothetical protein
LAKHSLSADSIEGVPATFEDSNSSGNVGIDSKATGQKMILSNIGENLALLNNGGNDDSVPATVPGSSQTLHQTLLRERSAAGRERSFDAV